MRDRRTPGQKVKDAVAGLLYLLLGIGMLWLMAWVALGVLRAALSGK